MASMWQVTVDVHTPTHRHGDRYFDNKQGQHANGHIGNVTFRVRVRGPHAVDLRVHHRDLI